MNQRDREGFFLSLLTTFGAGLAVSAINAALSRPYVVMPATALVQPEVVSDLAASLNGGMETAFILSAWDWVGRTVTYAGYGSDLEFQDSQVRCQRCLLPGAVLRSGQANCLGKSALLTSILRNRLPAERVFVAIGEAAVDGLGGHAWVEVEVDGQWYLLEATTPPGPSPWRLVDALRGIYIPNAYLNDVFFSCLGGRLCVSLSHGCPCLALTEVDGQHKMSL